jgi:hypothetical protein
VMTLQKMTGFVQNSRVNNMSNNIVVKCGQCSLFMQNNNPEGQGLCFAWQQKKAVCDSVKELSIFWSQALGGKDLMPENNRVCTRFSGRYEFEKGEYDYE